MQEFESENNSKILKNRLIYITWLPWSWKSFMAMFLSSFYEWIISNYKIYNNWVQINEDIKDMNDIENIENVWYKRCCILDEWWLNINARQGMSSENLDFIRLWVLSRKKNIDIIVISQLERLLDVAIRELCEFSFDMNSYFSWKEYLMFDCKVKNRYWYLVKNMKVDLIKFTRNYFWEYNTEETSIIRKDNKQKVNEEIKLANLVVPSVTNGTLA